MAAGPRLVFLFGVFSETDLIKHIHTVMFRASFDEGPAGEILNEPIPGDRFLKCAPIEEIAVISDKDEGLNVENVLEESIERLLLVRLVEDGKVALK